MVGKSAWVSVWPLAAGTGKWAGTQSLNSSWTDDIREREVAERVADHQRQRGWLARAHLRERGLVHRVGDDPRGDRRGHGHEAAGDQVPLGHALARVPPQAVDGPHRLAGPGLRDRAEAVQGLGEPGLHRLLVLLARADLAIGEDADGEVDAEGVGVDVLGRERGELLGDALDALPAVPGDDLVPGRELEVGPAGHGGGDAPAAVPGEQGLG
jgi:hypothetical protein